MSNKISDCSNIGAFCLLLLFSSIILIFQTSDALAQSNDPDPVTIGGSCTETDLIYHALTSSRTSWTIHDLYALPVGMKDPQTWQDAGSFHTQLTQVLQPPEDAAAFSEACSAVWQNFFSHTADVVVSLERSVTGSDQILQCQSNTWVLISTETTTEEDTSEWLPVGTFDVMSEASTQSLEDALQNLLDNLNGQPGAESGNQ